MRTWGARAAFALVMCCPLVAAAQEAPPYDPAVEVQLFDYPTGPKTFFAVDDANLAAQKQFSVDFMVTFLTNPMTIYNVSNDEEMIEGERTNVIKSMLAGQIGGAYGLNDRIQLGVALPVVFSESGDGVDPATARPAMGGLQISGLGDLRAEGKFKLWENEAMRLSATGALTLPSSFGAGGNDYLGDDLPTVRGHASWMWTGMEGKLAAGVNLGALVRFKTRTIYASKVGPQLTYGGGVAYSITDRFGVVGEMFGRTSGTALDGSPMEAGGGLRVRATKAIAVVIGGDVGVVKGIGSPDLRVFASVGYEPDTRDSDGDGIGNNKDKCPLVVEDDDGFEDGDGCPDDDNDHDLRADGEDKCPVQAEDIDGFDDDDGCPELDNDGDGIEDLEDRYCPMDKEDGVGPQPKDGCPADMRDTDNDGIKDTVDACYEQEEDGDGWDDADGCPEADNDGDGVLDDDDKCPLCMEDKDGAQDDDGCPEWDIDMDGIADEADKCQTEAEVINSIEDWDGCPDEGGAEVATFDGDRITFKGAVGFDKKGLTKAGIVLLDQAALLMMQHPEVTSWAVAVAAKKDKDVKARGAWVQKHLVSRGVDPTHIRVLAQKGKDAVVIGVEERSEPDPDAGFVCPAGNEAVSKAPAAAQPAQPEQPSTDADEPELE